MTTFHLIYKMKYNLFLFLKWAIDWKTYREIYIEPLERNMNAVMIPVLMQKFMNSEKNIDPE